MDTAHPRNTIGGVPVVETTESDCNQCAAQCCKYVSFEVDMLDRDYIRYLYYQGATVIATTDKDASVILPTKCAMLDEATNRCIDYENRPSICRSHTSRSCVDNPRETVDYRLTS